MTVFLSELRRGWKAWLVWTAAIGGMMAICILIYPEMAAEMGQVTDLFANMGSFSAAFGMDRINFGSFPGFFGVECGNVLGLGGGFYAAIVGITALEKEEREHTAEFLLAHPVTRTQVIAQKAAAAGCQITALNLAVVAVTAVCIRIIDEPVDVKTMFLLFLAYWLMQLEVGAITYGLSAFLRRGGVSIGLGLAACFYFANLLSNMMEKTRFLKYLTPYGYTESADILTEQTLNGGYLTVGAVITAAALAAAFLRYGRKDLS